MFFALSFFPLTRGAILFFSFSDVPVSNALSVLLFRTASSQGVSALNGASRGSVLSG